jgi:multidrug efflux system membrane fusion protein
MNKRKSSSSERGGSQYSQGRGFPYVFILGLLSVVLVSALFLAGCGSSASQPPARPPANVTVSPAVRRDVPVYLDEVGKCVARESVSIQPQVSGRIIAIHFEDGVELKKGDPLFTIDPRPYKAALDLAEANLAQARARLELTKIQFARADGLVDAKAISKQEYDTRKNAVDVARAAVAQREAEVDTAHINLEYTSIRSPIDGRAGHRLVDVGNVVSANTGSLLTIERVDPIYAEFTVTENDLTAVQNHMSKGSLEVYVSLPDAGAASLTGKLTFLDNKVQDPTGTVTLRATVHNPDHTLWPGRFVKVRLVLDTMPNAVLVPAPALQSSANGTYVYVVKKDSTAELRPVKAGQRQGDMVVIAEGLKPGERVVVKGQLGVMPGGKVNVDNSGVAEKHPKSTPGGES